MRALPALSLVFASAMCNPPANEPTFTDDEEDRPVAPEPLPALDEIGAFAPGRYAIRGEAVGADAALVAVQLVRADEDAFVVRSGDGPEQRVARDRGWPMLCTARPRSFGENDLRVRLGAGAPVYVLASSRRAARIGIDLRSHYSIVVARDELSPEGCASSEEHAGDAFVGVPSTGDAACLFPDPEPLDEDDGSIVPAAAAVEVLEESDEWSRVKVRAPAAEIEGWLPNALITTRSRGTPQWTQAALNGGRCVYPGRPVSPTSTVPAPEDEEEASGQPGIPPELLRAAIDRYEPQIRACYEARLQAVPDLSVSLEISLLVDSDGQVQRARVTRGAQDDAELARCVIERARRWRFPAPRLGSVSVSRSFTLRPVRP